VFAASGDENILVIRADARLQSDGRFISVLLPAYK
jgi:hypothetical protein